MRGTVATLQSPLLLDDSKVGVSCSASSFGVLMYIRFSTHDVLFQM